jgi:hypothetical protein
MSANQERIVAIEEKKGIHTVKTHHFLLPDGAPDYEDDTNKNFDFRLNVMTVMGAVPHSPMGRDGKLEASVWSTNTAIPVRNITVSGSV